MQLYFFRGEHPNFGDELNHVLLPKVFPSLFDENDDRILLGIGSIIGNYHPILSEKIVFGSGYGGYRDLPILDERWKFYCVRGALTAERLGLPAALVAADAAYLVVDHLQPDSRQENDQIAIMPHYESLDRGNWREVSAACGYTFIDPTSDVQNVIRQIRSSRLVLTEAMHGAIVSDALRVPWIALRPHDPRHHMKWTDWGSAVDVVPRFHALRPTSLQEAAGVGKVSFVRRVVRKVGKHLPSNNPLDRVFVERAAASLSKLAEGSEPQLSSDAALARALDKLRTAADRIRRDFG